VLVAAAVCPHPPLLVPELASGAAGELDELRAACDAALNGLAEANLEQMIVVGADPRGGTYLSTAGASMRPYGVDVRVGGADDELPLALAVGAWLVHRVGLSWPVRYVGVRPDASSQACLALGRTLAEKSPRTALLVMGDGSGRRTRQSPGRYDDRAEPFDAGVAAALSAGDVEALAALEPDLAAALMVAGRASWQVLAGAAESATRAGGAVTAELTYAAAPYGVSYFVASWRSE
jgi:hypothetical protein